MECLIDFIGIRGCGESEPASGQYINTLPGVSLESIDKIANSDQISYKGVWADVQTEASTRFLIDFMEELSNCFQLRPYCDYEDLICSNRIRLVKAWKYLLGNQLMLMRVHSNRLNRFTTIDLPKAEELAAFYQVEYEKSLKQAVKLIDTGSCCMECNNNPITVTWLP